MLRTGVAFLVLVYSCSLAWSQAAQPVTPVVNNAVVTTTNPLPIAGAVSVPDPVEASILLGGTPVAVGNPFPGATIVNGAAVTATNPFPVAANAASRMYAAATASFSRTTAGDIFCLVGSASKVVRIKTFVISASSSITGVIDVSLVLRSALNTGGTPTVLTGVPLNSTNAVATAVATVYATAPALGTEIGMIAAQKYTVVATVSPQLQPTAIRFVLDGVYDQPLTLNGASQSACLNIGAVAAGSWNMYVTWSEE